MRVFTDKAFQLHHHSLVVTMHRHSLAFTFRLPVDALRLKQIKGWRTQTLFAILLDESSSERTKPVSPVFEFQPTFFVSSTFPSSFPSAKKLQLFEREFPLYLFLKTINSNNFKIKNTFSPLFFSHSAIDRNGEKQYIK